MHEVIPHEYAGFLAGGILNTRVTNILMVKDLTNTSGWWQNLDRYLQTGNKPPFLFSDCNKLLKKAWTSLQHVQLKLGCLSGRKVLAK